MIYRYGFKFSVNAYFNEKWPSININEPCDSGNTALHAAVNKGKLDLVEILLRIECCFFFWCSFFSGVVFMFSDKF